MVNYSVLCSQCGLQKNSYADKPVVGLFSATTIKVCKECFKENEKSAENRMRGIERTLQSAPIALLVTLLALIAIMSIFELLHFLKVI